MMLGGHVLALALAFALRSVGRFRYWVVVFIITHIRGLCACRYGMDGWMDGWMDG